MATPLLRNLFATCTLCLAGFPLLPAAEWKSYYPEEATVLQGFSLQMAADTEEGERLYTYFAADKKIAYIEEVFATCRVAVCVRYLFDESGDFVAASCRISSLDISSEEWAHSQHTLIPGQLLKVDRCGINEPIDARADCIMKRCLADLEKLSRKKRK